MLNPVEYIQKIIISFLTAPLDEMKYEVRHTKLFQIQNQLFAGVLQDSFLKIFAKFTETHLCQNLFYNKVASEQYTYGRLLLKLKGFLSLKIHNKGNIDF